MLKQDSTHTAYIGVGSNMGARAENCRNAIIALADHHGCQVEGRSPFYETEPVGMEAQRWFVNGVVRIRTFMEPEELFGHLKGIEETMGRKRAGPRFGPRILDLDILFFDALVFRTEKLEIPHPRAHERRFVLRPLCDLDPDLIHPILKKSAQSLLDLLPEGKRVTVLS